MRETRMYMAISMGENQDNFGTSVGVGGGPVLLLRWTSFTEATRRYHRE